MKKFGFGKKDKSGGGDDEDAARSSLFGSRKKNQQQSTPSDNPYAQQGGGNNNDPYADNNKYANVSSYQQARSNLGPPGGPGAPPTAGYGADRYGSGGGYGGNRYETNTNQYGGSAAPSVGARGPGGYGGFGGRDEPDANRDALLGGAADRYAQRHQNPGPPGGAYGQQQPGQGDPSSASGAGDYGGYGEQRQLTEEEQDEADTQAILSEKRQVQQESVNSVSRSVQMARQANEVGRATLARLGAQGERLQNTEKNLDLASNQNKIAQDRAAELKTLNRSMFAVHVSNPFTSKQRQAAADEEVMNRHRDERDARETTRKEGYVANQRLEKTFREMDNHGMQRQMQAQQNSRKKNYGKFNLDDEEGADELEDQIDDGLDELEGQVSMMNMVGRAIGKEVDAQNKQIDRIMNKSDAVDDATRMNRERLARIK